MAKQDIKEYGTDLLKQFNDLEKKQKHLEAKIRKRAKLVLGDMPNVDPKYLLRLIINKEAEYVNQSRQTDLFNLNQEDND